jgi:cytochrome c biogenesis protein CcmG, thiol:disulfide interchange protein DsbE
MPASRAAAVLALLAALAAAGCVDAPASVAVGEPVPSFAAKDLDGHAVDLRDLRGEVVLLNVWATWCFPCRREMPAFEELHRELGDQGLRIVAVSVDAAGATSDIRDFVHEYDLSFDILHDPARHVSRAFQTIGVPETFLIDARGRLRRHWIGRIDPRADGIRSPIVEALTEHGGPRG